MADGVLEMRLVVTARRLRRGARVLPRHARAARARARTTTGDRRVTILDAGHATLELADPPHAAWIDEVEVGRRVAGHVRVAFQVTDAAAATSRLVEAGRHARRRARRDALALAQRAARGARRAAADAVRAAHRHRDVRLTSRTLDRAATMAAPGDPGGPHATSDVAVHRRGVLMTGPAQSSRRIHRVACPLDRGRAGRPEGRSPPRGLSAAEVEAGGRSTAPTGSPSSRPSRAGTRSCASTRTRCRSCSWSPAS